MSIENLILSNLLYNEEYSRKVIPFLKTDYFSDQSQLVIYKLIDIFVIVNRQTLNQKKWILVSLNYRNKLTK